MNTVKPSQEDIDRTLETCINSLNTGRSLYPGMSYEEGVETAINWILGDCDEKPIEDDDLSSGE